MKAFRLLVTGELVHTLASVANGLQSCAPLAASAVLGIDVDVLQWIGGVTGSVGAALLAMRFQYSGWGFVAFLVSNVFLIAHAIVVWAPGLIVLFVVGSVTSTIGVWRWLLTERLRRVTG